MAITLRRIAAISAACVILASAGASPPVAVPVPVQWREVAPDYGAHTPQAWARMAHWPIERRKAVWMQALSIARSAPQVLARTEQGREALDKFPVLHKPVALAYAIEDQLVMGTSPRRSLWEVVKSFFHSDSLLAVAVPIGTGWGGSTSAPAGSGQTAIGRFDQVPYQIVQSGETLRIGVSAWHINGAGVGTGITSVKFGADAPGTGDDDFANWGEVTSPSYNPDTGVWGYWATLSASQVGSYDTVEVRALITPSGTGQAKVLSGLTVYLDPSNTVGGTVKYVATTGNDSTGDGSSGNPYLTVGKALEILGPAAGDGSNCTVYCKAGNYEFFGANSGWYQHAKYSWVTVTHAPGLTRGDVVFNTVDAGSHFWTGWDSSHLRLYDITMNVGPASGDSSQQALWLDSCACTGSGFGDSVSWFGTTDFDGGVWVTDCVFSNTRSGPVSSPRMVRGCEIGAVREDAEQNCPAYFSCYVHDITPEAGDHPNVHQNTATASNHVMAQVRAFDIGSVAQASHGIFNGGVATTDTAIINVCIGTLSAGGNSEWGCVSGAVTHSLFWFLTITHQMILSRTAPNNFVASDMRHCYFESMSPAGSIIGSGLAVDKVHFRTGTDYGTNATTGSTEAGLFESPSTDDYRAKDGGGLDGLVTGNTILFDAAGNTRLSTTASGGLYGMDEVTPAAPSGLTLGTATATTQPVTWTDNASNETSFEVRYYVTADGVGTATTVTGIAANATGTTITGLTPSTDYTYQVRATNAAGSSSYSTSAHGSTAAAPSGNAAAHGRASNVRRRFRLRL